MYIEESKRKIFGKPLQRLYQRFLLQPESPTQPQLLKILSKLLTEQGVVYHPRTLKRQLLGNIEYVPIALQETLVSFITESCPASSHDQLLKDFSKEQAEIEQSCDTDLYVSPEKFLRLADCYLFHHKNESRRRLALFLRDRLKLKGISLGLETLQAALASKTQKVRKVLEEEIYNILKEGPSLTEEQIQEWMTEKLPIPDEIKKVEVGDITLAVEAYLLKSEGLSRRQLALELKTHLAEKGYQYHLSSIQSVLEGKTRKTRKVILDTLHELLENQGLCGESLTESIHPQQLHWNHYVQADKIQGWIQQIIDRYPQLTRRKIAVQLYKDLKSKNFHFSLNTLQFILAAKTQRVKKVILDLLEQYVTEDTLKTVAEQAIINQRQGRPSLANRVSDAYQRFIKSDNETDRERHRQELLAIRIELIRRLWDLKRSRYTRSLHYKTKRQNRRFADNLIEESAAEKDYDFDEPSVKYAVQNDFGCFIS